jgi:NADPH2:quinone reductase
MKAIQITQTGGPEVMSIREVPTPVPGPGELLIRVAASGVNFIDLYVREGRYANPVPFIPGQEASGTIAALGEGVRSIKEGDRVAWCSILGTYAEFALAPADHSRGHQLRPGSGGDAAGDDCALFVPLRVPHPERG